MIHHSLKSKAKQLAIRASRNHNPTKEQFFSLVNEFICRLEEKLERKVKG